MLVTYAMKENRHNNSYVCASRTKLLSHTGNLAVIVSLYVCLHVHYGKNKTVDTVSFLYKMYPIVQPQSTKNLAAIITDVLHMQPSVQLLSLSDFLHSVFLLVWLCLLTHDAV